MRFCCCSLLLGGVLGWGLFSLCCLSVIGASLLSSQTLVGEGGLGWPDWSCLSCAQPGNGVSWGGCFHSFPVGVLIGGLLRLEQVLVWAVGLRLYFYCPILTSGGLYRAHVMLVCCVVCSCGVFRACYVLWELGCAG